MKPAAKAVLSLTLGMLALVPAFAYEYPLSSTAIPEAYSVGAATNGESDRFFARYSRFLPALRVGVYMSAVTIETPFVQVAEYSRQAKNYTVEDALRDFLDKPPSVFRVRLDLCLGGKESMPARVKATQSEKDLVPSAVERTPYFASQRHGPALVIGEHVTLEFQADRVAPEPLTLAIDTPDRQHSETTFDLARLK